MNTTSKPAGASESIRRLALLCELDRLRLRLVMRPEPSDGVTVAGVPVAAVGRALAFTQFFPGAVGRVARSVAMGSALFRLVKPFVQAKRL